MRDIAELAGVSRTTVSHALSGHGRVKPATRERIRTIAEELGFVPSPTALALRTGRSGILAIVNATTGGSLEYFMLAANAASYEALESGYTLALVPNDRQDTWISRLPMDGAIILDPLDQDPMVDALRNRGTPIVTIGGGGESSLKHEPSIRADRVAGTCEVLDHLYHRGALRPALLIEREERQWILETREAYSQWMQQHDLKPFIVDTPSSAGEQAGYDAAQRLLAQPDVDAAYVPFAPMATGVLTALAEADIAVPHDFRIVVQEGAYARTGRQKLTALDDRPDEVARRAMHAMIQRLAHPRDTPRPDRVPLQLIPRDST